MARARAIAMAARTRFAGRMDVAFVLPDYHRGVPKACMDGWARRYLVVTPEGRVQPCHMAGTIPGLGLPHVGDAPLGELWRQHPAFTRYRGTRWMPEPCRSCVRRDVDFGGCRCQAYALTGDAGATDPACRHAPGHPLVLAARDSTTDPPSIDATHPRAMPRASLEGR